MFNIWGGSIINIEGKSNYKILIEKYYPDIKLKKFNVGIVNSNIFKKMDYVLWFIY